MRRWYDEDPERLEREVAELQAGEFAFERDKDYQRRTGLILMRGSYTRAGHDPVDLEVAYPDSFPYLRPEVFAPKLSLDRHQNPYRHNLCLLDRATRAWRPSCTAAQLIAEQGPKLLDRDAGGDPDAMRAGEVPQGEPASRYFTPLMGTVVFIPEAFLHLPEEHKSGRMRLTVGQPEAKERLVRGCLSVVEVSDEHGRKRNFDELKAPLATRFGQGSYNGSWVRLDKLPPGGSADANALLAAARQVEGCRAPEWQSAPLGGGKLRITGMVFREEVGQGIHEDGWLFAVETLAPPAKNAKGKPVVGRRNAGPGRYVVHGHRLTARDLTERIPTLRGLSEKTVALAGVGAMGAPLSFELARAQLGELRLLDHDIVDTGTVVRWPIGITAAGFHKLAVAESVLPQNWPFTAIRAFAHHVGVVPGPDQELDRPEHEVVTEFLDGASIYVDATAEFGVSHLISRLADEAGIPQVYVWGTEGGWGGGVARVIPGQTGCWMCLRKHIEDKHIKPPPYAETGLMQPRGCGTLTWTGSSFDALAIVAQAARVICGTLLHGRVGDTPSDVFICSQPPDDGLATAPQWTPYELTRHPTCDYCAARS